MQYIFEIWYQSCITEETRCEMMSAILKMINTDEKQIQPEVLSILRHWFGSPSSSAKSAMDQWFETSSKSPLLQILPNLTQKKARLSFAKYCLSGVFHSDQNHVGNPTLFQFPEKTNMQFDFASGNLFSSIEKDLFTDVQPSNNLIGYIVGQIKYKINDLKYMV